MRASAVGSLVPNAELNAIRPLNRLTIHIIAAVAEAVGRTISENTKTALAAAKARGVKLGNSNGARASRWATRKL
jgi:DNA invertase Pin-like site-specific DNA recombinase